MKRRASTNRLAGESHSLDPHALRRRFDEPTQDCARDSLDARAQVVVDERRDVDEELGRPRSTQVRRHGACDRRRIPTGVSVTRIRCRKLRQHARIARTRSIGRKSLDRSCIPFGHMVRCVVGGDVVARVARQPFAQGGVALEIFQRGGQLGNLERRGNDDRCIGRKLRQCAAAIGNQRQAVCETVERRARRLAARFAAQLDGNIGGGEVIRHVGVVDIAGDGDARCRTRSRDQLLQLEVVAIAMALADDQEAPLALLRQAGARPCLDQLAQELDVIDEAERRHDECFGIDAEARARGHAIHLRLDRSA